MISSFMLSHLVLPSLVSVCGHISFCFLLLSKWQSIETNFADGEPVPFAHFSRYVSEDVGPSWWAVFTPSWMAESIVLVVTLLAVCRPGLHTSVNARLMHYTSLVQTCAHAAFKVLLVRRCLTDRRESWFVTFSPLCEADAASNPPAPCTLGCTHQTRPRPPARSGLGRSRARGLSHADVGICMQLVMHCQKQPDTRGKRPGLPVSVLGLLTLVASCKLEGALATADPNLNLNSNSNPSPSPSPSP